MTWEGESAAGAAFHNQNSPAIKILRRKRRAAPRGAGITSAGSRGFQHMTRWLVSECLSDRRAVISDGDASTTIRRCIYHGKENYWLHQTASCRLARLLPAPPVGPALGQLTVSAIAGIHARNSTSEPKRISVSSSRSSSPFTLTVPSPSSQKLRRLLSSSRRRAESSPLLRTPNKTKVAKLTKEQVKQIAETKMPDLNAGFRRDRDEHDRRYRAQHGHYC